MKRGERNKGSWGWWAKAEGLPLPLAFALAIGYFDVAFDKSIGRENSRGGGGGGGGGRVNE